MFSVKFDERDCCKQFSFVCFNLILQLAYQSFICLNENITPSFYVVFFFTTVWEEGSFLGTSFKRDDFSFYF